jgi:cell division protein FtsN
MQNNHSDERKKKPFLLIIAVVAVLLAGAFVLYLRYMGPHPAQNPMPVVARGRIPPPPPSPSMESPAGPPVTMESEPPAGTDSTENAPGTPSQGDLGSPPPSSVETGPQESAPETASEIAVSPQKAAAPDPDAAPPADAAGDELRATADETPDLPQHSDTIAPPPSGAPAEEAEAAPAELSTGAPEAATPYTIQVGAYRGKDNADRQVALLREKGFDAYLYEKTDKNKRAWYFVRFGHFEDFGSADSALTVFKEQQKMDGAVVKSD